MELGQWRRVAPLCRQRRLVDGTVFLSLMFKALDGAPSLDESGLSRKLLCLRPFEHSGVALYCGDSNGSVWFLSENRDEIHSDRPQQWSCILCCSLVPGTFSPTRFGLHLVHLSTCWPRISRERPRLYQRNFCLTNRVSVVKAKKRAI